MRIHYPFSPFIKLLIWRRNINRTIASYILSEGDFFGGEMIEESTHECSFQIMERQGKRKRLKQIIFAQSCKYLKFQNPLLRDI